MVVIYAFVIFLLLLYYYFVQYKKNHHYFESAGVKYLPGVPVFGNSFHSTFAIKHGLDDFSAVYNAFPDERYVGYVEGTQRIIMVRDPELMKSILVKDFEHFVSRKAFFPVRLDPLIGSSLVSAQEKDWRRVRAKLTPAFTASKLKNMMSSMLEVSKNFINRLHVKDHEDVDLVKVISEYSTEIFSTSAFGFDKNLTEDLNNVLSEIYFNFGRRVLYFMSMQSPALGAFFQFLGIRLFPKKCSKFFREIVLEAIMNRRKQNIKKQDYLQVLMDASDGWSVDEVVGQVFFAFIANSETGTAMLALCIHQLALNPDIQETLYQEVKRCKEVDGDLTYENLSGLKYLECVLNESSRKYAAAIVMDRICTKPYYLPPPREGGKPYLLKPGDILYNVVNTIHDDPQYHPHPDAFDPDRFSEKNIQNIKPYTFMPFGMGPRGCLARRYMEIQMKVMLFHIVLNFKALRSEKTSDPVRLVPDQFTIHAQGGSWVKFEHRK